MRRLSLLLLLSIAGCRDLTVDEPPENGGLRGGVAPSSAVVEVRVIDEDGLRRLASAEGDGGFSATDLPPGLYALDVSGARVSPRVVPNVRVMSGRVTDLGVLQLDLKPSNSRLAGTVTPPQGGRIDGALVSYLLQPGDQLVAAVAVDGDGRFVAAVPPGTYALRAAHPDYVTAMATDITLEADEVRDVTATHPLALQLNPATLEGTVLVKTASGGTAPAQAALVTLENGQTTTTDPLGAFRMTGLPAGAQTLRVALANYVDPTPTRTVALRAGQLTTVPAITLDLQLGSAVGDVVLSDGAPIADVEVTALSNADMNLLYAGVVSPDPAVQGRGLFVVNNLPLGSYTVQATRNGYSRASAQVSVVSSSPTQVGTLRLALQQGDFLIDDADPANTPGYTRTQRVVLRFTGFPTTGVTEFRVSEDPSFADAGFAPYTGVQQPFDLLDGGDGARTLYAQYRDTSGSTSPTFVNSVYLDTVPPAAPGVTIAHTGTPNGATRFSKNQLLPLTITGADLGGVALMRISGNPGDGGVLGGPSLGFQGTTSFDRGAAPDGVQAVFVQLVDNAGNQSVPGQDQVVVDRVAPTVPTVSITPGPRSTDADFTNTPFVDVNITATPQANGEALYMKVANDNSSELAATAWAPRRNQLAWILRNGDGAKAVHVLLQDSAGNEAMSTGSDAVTLDTTPPQPVSASLAGGGLVRSSPVQVTLASSATDLSATQALTLADTSALATTPMPFTPSAMVPLTTISPTPGVYPATIFVRFRDKAGNDSLVTLPFTYDNEAPRGTITLRGQLADGTRDDTLTSSSTVTVEADVEGATGYLAGEGVASCPDPVSSPGAYTALPASGTFTVVLATTSGTAVVRACFRDAAGNVLGGASGPPLNWAPAASIAVDGAPPTGCALNLAGKRVDGSAAPAGRTAQQTIDVRVQGCSGDAREQVVVAGAVTCTSPGLDWQPLGTTALTVPAGDGVKTVSACVRDAARNVMTVPAANVTLDTTPPLGVSAQVEFGEGILNIAEATTRGGPRVAFQVTWGDAVVLEARTIDWRGSSGPVVAVTPSAPAAAMLFSDQLHASALAQPVDLGIAADYDGNLVRIGVTFADDLGNETPESLSTLNVDLVAPAAPTLQGVAPGNRSAVLSWLPPSNTFDIVKYELVYAGMPSLQAGEAPVGAQQGVATGLENRREYTFHVRSRDDGDNLSPLSNPLVATAGWRRSLLPINSPYPLRPLDIAVRGADLYVAYSERDVDGPWPTGNVRMATSHDRGATWTLSTVDSVFGWNRSMARILIGETGVSVVTVGSDQDATSGTATPALGEAKLFTSPDGVTWTKYSDANLTNSANWAEVGGVGLVDTGTGFGLSIYNLFYFSNPAATNLLRRINTFQLFGSSLSTFHDYADTLSVSDLRVCNGNYAKLMMWKEGTTVRALSHRFLYDADFVTTEGDVTQVQTGADAFDFDCSSAPAQTNAFAVFRAGSTISARGRAGVTGAWLGTLGSIATDADTRFPPRVHAVGQRAYVVYRPASGGVRMSVLRESFGSFSDSPPARIEAGATEGAWPVVGGDAVDDVVVAFADLDGTAISVLVPELQGVTAQVAQGIDTATIRWTASGFNNYLVGQSPSFIDTLGLGSPLTDNYVAVPAFDVGFPATTPEYYQVGIADAHGQSSGDGEVWQVSPFRQTDVLTPLANTSSGSNTAGVVAHDANVVVMPHFGAKATGDSDLTLYRSGDQGATWSAFQPPAAATTTAARALVGAGGRAVLAYRLSASAGLRARLFSGYGTAATYPVETVLDATSNVDFVAAGSDGVNRVAIATANVATDELTLAWSSDNGASFVTRPRLLVPSGATYAISALAVWRVDQAKVVLAWRQSTLTSQRIYFAESTDQGLTFAAPVLVFDGTTGSTGNQYVASTTLVQGSGNGAYSVVGSVSQDATTPPTQNNLWLSVTGTDHPASATLSQFVLDQQPANKASFDLASNLNGHQVVYTTSNLGAVTDTYLKLATCVTNCHLLSSWYRTTLASFGPGLTLAPRIGTSTTQSGVPRTYVVFREGGRIRVLRGGLTRRLQ